MPEGELRELERVFESEKKERQRQHTVRGYCPSTMAGTVRFSAPRLQVAMRELDATHRAELKQHRQKLNAQSEDEKHRLTVSPNPLRIITSAKHGSP